MTKRRVKSSSKNREIPKTIPNEWCPVDGLPAFMYLPVPHGAPDSDLLERHVRHWIETGDWDEERQAGFWLYTAYRRALPKDRVYLADRIMNLNLAFPDRYEEELRRTLRGVLASSPDFDWEPYFTRTAGEQKLS